MLVEASSPKLQDSFCSSGRFTGKLRVGEGEEERGRERVGERQKERERERERERESGGEGEGEGESGGEREGEGEGEWGRERGRGRGRELYDNLRQLAVKNCVNSFLQFYGDSRPHTAQCSQLWFISPHPAPLR